MDRWYNGGCGHWCSCDCDGVVIVTIVRNKSLIQKMMKTGSLFSNSIVIHFIDFFRSHDDGYQLNIGVLCNPNYEQTFPKF